MFNAKCLLILTLLVSVICFGCNDRTSQMMKPVVEELLVEEPEGPRFCQVGDVLHPGESCYDNNWGIFFQVLGSGHAKYLILGGSTALVADFTAPGDGIKRNFSAEKQNNGTWLITSVTPAQPLLEGDGEPLPGVKPCEVGDVLQPGEWCLDGTGDLFWSGEPDARGYYSLISWNRTISFEGPSPHDGRHLNFEAEPMGDGTWRINKVSPLEPVAEEPEEVDVPANGILVYVDPEQITSPAVGEHLQVSIQIAHAADVVGYQFTLEFDPTALRYVESSHADYLPGVFEIPSVISENSVLMAAALDSGAAGASSGTLATLTFEVIAAKASTLTLSEVILSNTKAEGLPLTTENGEISTPFVPDEPVDEPLVEEPERQFTPFEGLTISDDGTVSLIVGRAEMHAGPGRCIIFDNSSLNGIRYDVHDFFWAYRADDNSDFRAIEGTQSDRGICGYEALTEPGQYRIFLDFSMNGNRHDAVSQNVIEIKLENP